MCTMCCFTGSDVLAPSSSATLLAPISSPSHVGPTNHPLTSHSLPKLTTNTSHTLNDLTSSTSSNPPVLPWEVEGGREGQGNGKREVEAANTHNPKQDEEVSLSSLPLSLTDANR